MRNSLRLFRIPLFFLIIIGACTTISAQSLKGKLTDASTASPLPYASIRVLQVTDNKLVGGGLTNEKGAFSVSLPYGNFLCEVEYIGYKTIKTSQFTLTKENAIYDLGNLQLNVSSSDIEEVTVTAEKSTMVLALDKKVFNVGKDLANAGGSANDILTNIPSVSVDPEGNVKLRGSDNVRILIDGKPSGLVSFKGSSGLQQLQASMIEKVEIITNPSARYEAEGSAGIINIVLKKDNRQGFNGSFEVLAGFPTNYGASANLNYRHRKMNFFINYGLSYRESPGNSYTYQERTPSDTTFILKQTATSKMKMLNNSIRGGLDFFFTEKSILTATYFWKRSDANRLNYLRYEDYVFNLNNYQGYSTRVQDETEDEPNSEYSLVYKKKFAKQGQELTGEVKYLNYWEHSVQIYPQKTYTREGVEDISKAINQNSLNDEYENQLLTQLDYVHPIGKDGKIETGFRSSFREMINDYTVNNVNTMGQETPVIGLVNYFIYNENINSVYGIYGNKIHKFSFQLGLRFEHTDIETLLRETNEKNPRKYPNLFPSVHFTYKLPKENAIQLSYSRRIRRPGYNDLSPFFTFVDSRNFWSGNPDLNPEFSDVIELGHVKYFEKGSFASSIYYRNTANKIDRIRFLDAAGFARTRPENLNFEKSFGVEFSSGYSPKKWWKLDFNANFFHANIDGSNLQSDYKATTYSWFLRQTSKFMLPHHFDFQIRGNYEAPQKTAQGSRKALYFFDLGTNKDVFKGKGTLTLSVTDLFNTRKNRNIILGANYFNESEMQWRRRQVNLTLNYRINQNKQAGKKMTEE
jgi:ferric enterobactin receptor